MARTWLSVRVDLVGGGAERCWPRPGRVFVAARRHTFFDLADAIDVAFARWDRAHLREFELADRTRLTRPDPDWDDPGATVDYRRAKLSRLQPGEQFVYVFDLGDDWAHLCTVAPDRVDPEEVLGFVPGTPVPYFGWGALPDQYGRRWEDDDGEDPVPPDPELADLPPLRPDWGPQAVRRPRRPAP